MFGEDVVKLEIKPWEIEPEYKVNLLPHDNFEVIIIKGNQNLTAITKKALKLIGADVSNSDSARDLISGQIVRSDDNSYYKGRLVFKDDDVNTGFVLKIIVEKKKNHPGLKSESEKKEQQNKGRAVLGKPVLKIKGEK